MDSDPIGIMVRKLIFGFSGIVSLLVAQTAAAQIPYLQIYKEQRSVQIRSPKQLPSVGVPQVSTPFTVRTREETRTEQPISLDEAIQLALRNAEVIRVLTGISATTSGRTIYDVPVNNTAIDEVTAVFDPQLTTDLGYGKDDPPNAIFDPTEPDPTNPQNSVFSGLTTESLTANVGLSKRLLAGGTARVNVNAVNSYFDPGVFPLNPRYRSFAEISLRQPLMRGFGRDINRVPIVVARIDTERSYFQFKDSVQELVRGVIAAYWNVVSARVDVWARKQQIKQAEFAVRRATARKNKGLDRAADVAQARSALANFQAGLITARSNLILFETALRNIIGLEPSNDRVLVPTTMPELQRIEFDWNEIVGIAELYRPDIIELKLILEADQQQLLQANNLARPQLDSTANYRWDGLSGEVPSGALLPNEPGRFAGFNVGINFSVPLGLRQSRAALRRRELLIARDKANLNQGVYQMVHQLTINYRNLDQFFEQYRAFKEVREAARLNYENQAGEVLAGRREFLNVLQAITDWGNAVSQEARSIAQYNTELANLERETGTILETHGIRFLEERFCSIGPRGLLGIRPDCQNYSQDLKPQGGVPRYRNSASNSDESFNLEDLDIRRAINRDNPRALSSPPTIEAPRPEIDSRNHTFR